MAGDDDVVLVSEDRAREAEAADRGGELRHLRLVVRTRVPIVSAEGAYLHDLDRRVPQNVVGAYHLSP